MPKGIYVRTPEIIRKQNEGKLGKPSPLKGRKRSPLSDEWKAKISKANKGRTLSDEWKEKLSKALKNKPLSEEHKRRISEGGKGRCCSEETKKKIGIANKGKRRSVEVRKKMSEFQRSRKLSEEHKRKIGNSCRGEKNGNWKGGISTFKNLLRTSVIYKVWRKGVFIKDQWTCQDCGKRGGNLEAHHLYPFAELLRDYEIVSMGQALKTEELWNINNGLTLCLKCHNLTKKGYLHLSKEKINDNDG